MSLSQYSSIFVYYLLKTKTVLKVALTSATVMAHPDVEMIFKEKVKEAVVVINPDSFRTFERHVG